MVTCIMYVGMNALSRTFNRCLRQEPLLKIAAKKHVSGEHLWVTIGWGKH